MALMTAQLSTVFDVSQPGEAVRPMLCFPVTIADEPIVPGMHFEVERRCCGVNPVFVLPCIQVKPRLPVRDN